jgi:hypothetical protein
MATRRDWLNLVASLIGLDLNPKAWHAFILIRRGSFDNGKGRGRSGGNPGFLDFVCSSSLAPLNLPVLGCNNWERPRVSVWDVWRSSDRFDSG